MLHSSELKTLPNSNELISSDDAPVDNEDQNFIPNYLLFLLEYFWKQRQDWYFAVDMAVYHVTGANPRVPVVPDAFLSLGVPRQKQGQSRNSYVLWEESNIVPTLALEIVSQTPGGEYDSKCEIYRRLGVLYYAVYNARFWQRDGHSPLEIYKLIEGKYQLQVGEPVWMPEVGLGIGRCALPNDPLGRETLSWFDQSGQRILNEAEAERQRADRLAERLRELGEAV
jgi:Uma2 family endonuclease